MNIDELVAMHYTEFQDLVVSPDGQEVLVVLGNEDMPYEEYVYGRKNRSIWTCDLNGNREEKEIASADEDAHRPCWSPDRKQIAYLSRKSGQTEIWLMDRDGANKVQVTNSHFPGRDPYNETQLSWSPDGLNIVYTCKPNGSYYGIAQALKDKEEIITGIQVTSASDSSNKWKNAFQKANEFYESALYSQNVVTGENKILTTENCKIVDWASGELVFVARGATLKTVNIHTREMQDVYVAKQRIDSVKICEKALLIAYQTEQKN